MSKPITKYSATERQQGKKELEEQLPREFFTYSRCWWDNENYSPYDGWEDWSCSSRFNEITIGGKFLVLLGKLDILEQEYYNGRRYFKHSETYGLFEKLAIAPDGYIYATYDNEVVHYKLDIPKATR